MLLVVQHAQKSGVSSGINYGVMELCGGSVARPKYDHPATVNNIASLLALGIAKYRGELGSDPPKSRINVYIPPMWLQ